MIETLWLPVIYLKTANSTTTEIISGSFWLNLNSAWSAVLHLFFNTWSWIKDVWSVSVKTNGKVVKFKLIQPGKSRRIVWVCLTILWGWRWKG